MVSQLLPRAQRAWGKVMVAVIVPAVEPQPGLPVHRVLHVQRDWYTASSTYSGLFSSLPILASGRTVIISVSNPHLLRVLFRRGNVLHAAVFSTRHLMHIAPPPSSPATAARPVRVSS